MNMGLPWRDVTLENLNHKMKILDKLTKEDFRKFLVDLRPEFFDESSLPSTKEDKTKPTSKMLTRLARKNVRMQQIDDEFDKAMKMSNEVIN